MPPTSPTAATGLRSVERGELLHEASQLLDNGRRLALVACHEDDDGFRIVYVFTVKASADPVELIVTVPGDDAWVPSLAGVSFPAGQFERELYDLYGVRPDGHPQPHRLLRHSHWPHAWHPMLRATGPEPVFAPDTAAYPFTPVEGPGVYEIAVGPVHAGIIEPGHFRFSVVGETIIRMETRLWFLHRGVEKLFEGRSPADGISLAEQITGDTSIGHSLAFAIAVEAAGGVDVPESDRLVRAVLLELERLYNHVTDLGALAGDAGFGIASIHAQRLRESLMRINRDATGHRLLRGSLKIGGARIRSLPEPSALRTIAEEVAELARITLGHPIVRDRFDGTGILSTDQARALGVLGYVARASGIDVDARGDGSFVDLGERFTVTTEVGGDVLARYLLRAREFAVSTDLVIDLIARLGNARGDSTTADAIRSDSATAFVEGWRGTIAHRIELGSGGNLARVKIVDPSFFNWPALPVALSETIVPDFPLTNKSFNQSYAGNDL